MNTPDAENLVEKIISKIDFNLKRDEKHYLTRAIEQYFEVQQSMDNKPRPGTLLESLRELKKKSRDIAGCVSRLDVHTRDTLASFHSKQDNRDVNQVLDELEDRAAWLAKKTARVTKIIIPRLPKDKGGARRSWVRLFLTHHLLHLYTITTGKKAGSNSIFKDKAGKDQIGPAGRFVKSCLDVLGPPIGLSAIANIIKKAKELGKTDPPPEEGETP